MSWQNQNSTHPIFGKVHVVGLNVFIISPVTVHNGILVFNIIAHWVTHDQKHDLFLNSFTTSACYVALNEEATSFLNEVINTFKFQSVRFNISVKWAWIRGQVAWTLVLGLLMTEWLWATMSALWASVTLPLKVWIFTFPCQFHKIIIRLKIGKACESAL